MYLFDLTFITGGTVHMICQHADEKTRKEIVEKTGNMVSDQGR